ncbi:MAG TPA: GGDEF domain-containing protein [Gaiellaceae bacterium]|nr:GGDEF domain-containing protein [Gaiellaceae bacterium]
MSARRGWILGVVGAAVVAAAVLLASEQQRTTAETNFKEAQAGVDLQVALLSQERALDGYLASGSLRDLDLYFSSRQELTNGLLTHAARLSRDDAIEARAIADQASAYRRWSGLANAAVTRKRVSGVGDTGAGELGRSRLIDRFMVANRAYQDRLTVNRDREQHAAALLPVWTLLGLAAVFALISAAAQWVARGVRRRQDAFRGAQAEFVEAIQFADSEEETHALVRRHLEGAIPGSDVLVLNRNNSLDRLEPSRPLPDDHPLADALISSEPRSCLAVRLSRRYDRGGAGAPKMFDCELCGRLGNPSSCEPLLVGGEVIGSVLISSEEELTVEDEQRVAATVTQAAPVLANLRNLAIAESRAATDALTGLANRRSVDDSLRRMVAQADRSVARLSVALIDLDHFKEINDTYGHDRGDDVLAALAAMLRSEVRESDFAGRSGGEEFVLFLPNTDRDGALRVAEKLRANVTKLRIAGVDRTVTASFGVATFPDDAATPAALMRAADRALYQAKQAGRDRVATVRTAREPVESANGDRSG